MAERIPQSVAIRVPLQAFLASDHVSPATGLTIVVTISKNGAVYGNPSAGATNATEIANGSYYVDLSTTDTGTVGPLFVRGAASTMDPITGIYNVVTFVEQTGDAYARLGAPAGASHSADVAAVKVDTAAVKVKTDFLPSATAGASGGVFIAGTNAATSITTGLTAHIIGTVDTVTTYTGNTPQTGDAYARLGAPAGASVSADVAATKALLPTALVGGKMDSHVNDIASGAITATSIAADAITDAKVASDVTIASVTGAVGSVTGAVGSVTGAVGSVTGNVGGNVVGSVASVVGAVGSVTGLTASNLDVAVSTRLAASSYTAPDNTDIVAIKAKTDNLPASPADETLVIAATNAIMSRLGAPAGASVSADVAAVKSDTAAVKAKTDNLPASPAATGSIPSAATVASAVWEEALSGHTTVGTAGKSLSTASAAGDPWLTTVPGSYAAGTAGYKFGNISAAGAGAISWPYTLTNELTGLPIADADVWVTTDSAGTNVIASGTTNASGVVTFMLDAGTVYVWRQKSGFNFVNPDAETVS